MSGFLDAVAGAALPVAVGLLVLAAVARAVLWAPVAGVRARRTARQYAEPLSIWCLTALVVYALASAAAGTASFPSIALTLLIAAAAVLLRPAADATRRDPEERPPAAAAAPAAEAPAPAATAPVAEAPAPAATAPVAEAPAPAATAPVAGGSLWANAGAEEPARRQGLWSR